MTAPRLAIVVKGYPRLSETFIARELEALEARGLDFTLHALRQPGADAKFVENKLRAAPCYLPEYLHEAPLSVARGAAAALMLPGFEKAWRAFVADLRRDWGRARVRRFGQACVLAHELPPTIKHIHAHFAHSPTSVARYAALLRGATYSISAHAKDIWTAPDWDLAEKIGGASFTTVCNRTGFDRLVTLAGRARVLLNYHGIAREAVASDAHASVRDGASPSEPVRIVCVARAVAKKGLATLVEAAARLPRDLAVEIHHIGGGELLPSLKAQAASAGVADRFVWHGSQAHARVLSELDQSDIFVLPAVVGADGDRDGIPNALLEAQARGLAVVSTDAGGIGETVTDGQTGRLVRAGDAEALAAALTELARAPALRGKLGAAALAHVRADFNAEATYDALASQLRTCVGA